MSPKSILQTLAGLLVLAALAAGIYAVHSYRSMAERVVTLEGSAKELTDLKQSVATLQKEAARRASQDQAIRDSRAVVNRSVETAANESPVLRAYLDERIPDELRRAHAQSVAR